METLLGIDIGTSGCKVLQIDESGKVVKQASAEYPLSTPQPLWSEQSPEDWWTGYRGCASQLGGGHAASGVTGQMHGAVFLGAESQVLRPAILWNDQRTVAECEEIDRRVGRARLLELTANPPLTGFQAPKILWLRNHEPESFSDLRHVLLPKDYIRYRITGELATEPSDASGTGLLDVPRRSWSEEVMADLELRPEWFPPVRESWEVCGRDEGGRPVVGGGGDQAAAAVGTGAVRPGIISVSLGTSGVVFTALEEPESDPSGAAHTFCHANGRWHSMGVMLSCGGALRWYRDTFATGSTYDELAAEAQSVAPGADGVTFLPYLAGERCPHNDPYATGAFAGLRLSHSRAHLTRAVFEAITFGLKDCLDLLTGLGAAANEVRVTGGGAKSSFWLQLLADVFELPCATLVTDEGPAFGAALLAGVGVGVWDDIGTACERTIRVKSVVDPKGVPYEAVHDRYRELYRILRDRKPE